MLSEYIPPLLFAMTGVALPIFLMLPGRIIRPFKPNEAKKLPYECGSVPEGEAVGQRSVQYFRYAILFVVFEVEILFVYAWGGVARNIGLVGFFELTIFVLILLLGLIYAWRKGVLEWA